MRLCSMILVIVSVAPLSGCLVREPRSTPDQPNPPMVAPVEAVEEARDLPPAPELPQAILSVAGDPLPAVTLPEETRIRYEANLDAARLALRANPNDLDASIWVGRRLAYLGRYLEAIEHYTEALREHPDSPELYRHRGHRFITIRRFDTAIADLERATKLVAGTPDRIEADGLPNARNIPTSTLQTNIAYHLGLARFLTGDFDGAAEAFAHCRTLSRNPDMLVATLAWHYAALGRAGRIDEAKRAVAFVDPDWDIIENAAYHSLCLVYRGRLEADALLASVRNQDDSTRLNRPTTLYGLANHARLQGDVEGANALCREILALNAWAAFGSIAAEVDLHRSRASGNSERSDSTRSPRRHRGSPGGQERKRR